MTKLTNILLGSLLLVSVVFLIGNSNKKPDIRIAEIDRLNARLDILSNEIYKQSESFSLGGIEDLTRKGTGVYATTVAISITLSSSTLAIASNPSIAYRRIQNIGDVAVTCQLGNATSTLAINNGIKLATTGYPGNTFEQTLGYWGAIRCIAETSTGTISVIQY